LSGSTLALITVPFFTGAIGYVTNWTGSLMLFSDPTEAMEHLLS
jgi:hypothetical protein